MSEGLLDLLLPIAIFLVGYVYLFPVFLAAHRGHPDTLEIGVLNVTVGWTIIGWFWALAWAIE